MLFNKYYILYQGYAHAAKSWFPLGPAHNKKYYSQLETQLKAPWVKWNNPEQNRYTASQKKVNYAYIYAFGEVNTN